MLLERVIFTLNREINVSGKITHDKQIHYVSRLVLLMKLRNHISLCNLMENLYTGFPGVYVILYRVMSMGWQGYKRPRNTAITLAYLVAAWLLLNPDKKNKSIH